MTADNQIKGRIAFVRVRVMSHLSEVTEGATRDEWVVQPITRGGRDIDCSCPWVPREALLTVEEIQEAFKQKGRGNVRPQ
jgi:hypothetical protein